MKIVGTTLEKHIYVDNKDKLKKQKNYLNRVMLPHDVFCRM
jgi:hypothetical protein